MIVYAFTLAGAEARVGAKMWPVGCNTTLTRTMRDLSFSLFYVVLAVFVIGCAHLRSKTPPVVQIKNDNTILLNGRNIQSGTVERVLHNKFEDTDTVLVCVMKNAQIQTYLEIMKSIASSGQHRIILGVDDVCGAEWAKRQIKRESSMIELRLEPEKENDND